MLADLDTLDRKILFSLDCNSRQSVSDLARNVRHGRDQVEYRLKKLVDTKLIRKFVTSVNPCKFGFTLFKVYFRLENKKSRIGEFILHLKKHPRTYWLALCDGSWDLVLIFFARNAHEFHGIHNEMLSEFNDVVLNFTAYTLIEYKSYSRRYLTKAEGIRTGVGGPPEGLLIDKVDFEILGMLAENSRASTIEIGERTGVSHQTVRYRIERMEEHAIINGYRIELDLSQLGMLHFKTQFFLRNYQLSLREHLIEYCENNPHITSYIEQVGDCNIEIEMEVANYEQYSEIVDEIREEYAKLVRNFSTMLIRKANRYPVPREMGNLAGTSFYPSSFLALGEA